MEQVKEPMGAHKRGQIKQISQIPAVAQKWKEIHVTTCTESDVDAMFADFIPKQLAVLIRYADLIPGTLEAVIKFRDRSLKIGSTTGYTGEMMKLLLKEAKKRGYEPDSTVCATDVSRGRPAPWMCLKNAENFGVYPPEAYVKIGDTLPDIDEINKRFKRGEKP